MKRAASESKSHLGNNALAIDFTRDSEVLQIFPSGSLLSSHQGQWKGVHLSYYQHPAHEIPETVSHQHLILIQLETSIQVEQKIETKFQKDQLQVGNIVIVPAHTSHYARWDREHRYLILSLDQIAFLHMAQAIGWDRVELMTHFATADPLIYGIGLALKAELESNGLGGQLYVDSLSTTLLTHLLRHYTVQKPIIPVQEGGLSTYHLRQVCQYIDAFLDRDLALAELAAIAHMSPNYFTQLFKQSTGLTPHQYVIQRRVERARQLLLEGKRAIADIALQVGFAHQSHLNRHFKRCFGLTPKVFLKNQ